MRGLGLGLGFGGSRPWQKSLPGLALWLRADASSITTGTGVKTWADQSGVGDANHNVSNNTGSQQPTFTASDAAYNGRSTLSFARASSQHLVSGVWSSALSQPYTFFLVGNDDGSLVNIQYYFDGLVVNTFAVEWDASGHYTFRAGASQNYSTAASATPRIFAAIVNGASTSAFVSTTTPTTISPGTGGATGITIGAASNLGASLSGKIAEMLVCRGALTLAQTQAAIASLSAYYGIALS